MKTIKSLLHQQGYLTLISVALIVIVGFITVALAYITFGSAFATLNLQKSTSALYIAESGLEDGIHELVTPIIANRNTCTGLNLTNTVGEGTYTVTSTGPFYTSSPTTLNGALTNTATTITVASTTNYQHSGRIMIDQELMDYTATDATHFLFVERGQAGTTAAPHATGTSVGQYQCSLTSTGGDPKITYASGEPGGKRILNEMIQLEEGWAVGNASGTLTFMRWNRPTEGIWNNASVSGSFNINSISMNSYVDGWAVGASTNFLRWNGSSWSGVASGLSNVTYNEVYCWSKNNCHVVGNMVSNNSTTPTIADWNGTNWTPTSVDASSRAGHQYGIHCGSANDCWSVGDRGLTTSLTYFYRWNGSAWAANSISGFASGDFPYRSVACPSTTNCWAVGSSSFFARWNGSSWSRFSSGMPSAQYNSIYCNNTTDCWAVGRVNSSRDLIIHWDGAQWSRDSSNPTPTTDLNHVTCISANNCWAVGAANGGEPTFLHWDGDTWIKFATTGLPNVAGNTIAMIGPDSRPWSSWSANFS